MIVPLQLRRRLQSSLGGWSVRNLTMEGHQTSLVKRDHWLPSNRAKEGLCGGSPLAVQHCLLGRGPS